MKFLFLSIAMLLMPTQGYGASSYYENELILDANYDDVIEWTNIHKDRIIESTRVEILERDGEKLKLRKKGTKTNYEFYTQEATDRTNDSVTVTHKFIESTLGDIVAQENCVVIERLNSKTIIRFRMEAEVAESVTSKILMQLDVAASFASFKRLFEERFGKELEDYDPSKDVPVVKHQSATEPIMFVVFLTICALLSAALVKDCLDDRAR